MAYDALDRVTSVQAPFGAVLTYSYDPANNRTLMQDSLGGTTTRTYDALNRVTTIQFGGARPDAAARGLHPHRTRPGGDPDTLQRPGRVRPRSALRRSATMLWRLANLQHYSGSGTLLANYTNTYDLASRITAETLNSGAPTTYSYDAVNELTNDTQVTYTYDLNGNRTMTGYTTGSANQLTSDGTWNYYQDQNGNLTAKRNISTGEWWSYGYDNANRLISATDTTTSLQTQATYVYDALAKRIEKDVWTQSSGSTTTTRFAYDGAEICADLTSANALQTRYLRGSQVLELLARIASSATAAWILADRMGTVRHIVDNTGAVIDTLTYDGYGNVTNETNPTNGGVYKYAGYRSDSETGWLRPDPTVGRLYIPLTGRWQGEDFIGFVAGDANLLRLPGQ